MKRLASIDIKYALSQVFYFGAFSAMMGYASVYLLDKGFSNSTIGIVLSICSVLAVVLQPMLASYADKHNDIPLRKIVSVVLIALIALIAGLILFPLQGIVLLAIIVAIFAVEQSIMPLMNSLAFSFEKYGYEVNYGLARGLGSVSYAIVSMILGYLIDMYNPDILPIFYLIFNLLLIALMQIFVLPKTATIETKEEDTKEEKTETKQLSLIQFCAKYKKFMVFVLGFVFVYFAHTIINNFFIQIITNVGGTTSDMGNAVFLAAMLELPTMALFTKVAQKVDCGTLIKISIIMFAVKHGITYIATNMVMIYIAQACQMFAYALFIPASVYYVNNKIDGSDAIKGQSMVTVSMTLAGVIGNLCGGILLDVVGVSNVLLVSVALSILGGIIVILSTEKVSIKEV